MNTVEVSSLKRLKEAIQKKEDTETESERLPKSRNIIRRTNKKELALKQVNGKIDSLQLVKEGEQQVYQRKVIVSDQTAKNKLSLDAYKISGEVLKKESIAIEVAPKRLNEEQVKEMPLSKKYLVQWII